MLIIAIVVFFVKLQKKNHEWPACVYSGLLYLQTLRDSLIFQIFVWVIRSAKQIFNDLHKTETKAKNYEHLGH